MKVFKFLPPYRPGGKTTFPDSKKRTGVYLIKENGKLVYIGYSASDLYKTMYRHFQEWNDRTQQIRITYYNKLKTHTYTVRIIYCTTKQAARLEGALILKYQPRDNTNNYQGFELDAGDNRLIDDYKFTIVEQEAPF